MAMAAPSSPADRSTAFTDCRHCGCLCLGPAILPCGHVTCRKCLRHLVHDKKPCPDCQKSLAVETDPAVGQLTQLFSSELVLHDLVNQRLQDLGQQSCEVCQNRDATMICQDCGEMYCDACSTAHRKMKVSRDHVQQALPHTLYNAPPGTQAASGSGHRQPSPTSVVADDITSLPGASTTGTQSENSITNLPGASTTGTQREDSIANLPGASTTGTQREDNITNLPGASSTGTRRERQWLDDQVKLLQRTRLRVQKVAQAAHKVSTRALGLADEAQRKEEILNLYTNRLSHAEVTRDEDGRVCVSGLSDTDVTGTAKTEEFEERLRDVRKICQQYDVMETLQSECLWLMQNEDNRSDPMTATPRPVFETTAVTDQDTSTPWISDVLTTHDGRLLMADYTNKMIKVVAKPLSGEHTLPALKLEKAPLCMCLLSDGLVAVTADDETVYLVDVCSHVTIRSQFKTSRQYGGVTGSPNDDTLLVSCNKDADGPAGVDVIRRDGSLARTVVGSNTLTGLENVFGISVVDSHVLISDCNQHCVYKVEVTSGRLVDTMTHPDLKFPIKIVADADGNVYITCGGSEIVLVRSCEGEWRRLLHAPQHGGGENSFPWALCLTKGGIVVVWFRNEDKSELEFIKMNRYQFVQ